MIRRLVIYIFSAMSILHGLAVSGAEVHGVWRVSLLDSRNIVLAGEYSDFLRDEFVRRLPERMGVFNKLPGWAREYRFSINATEIIADTRPRLAKLFSDASGIKVLGGNGEEIVVKSHGYWLNPVGLAGFTGDAEREALTRNVLAVHYIFLEFARELPAGEELTIKLPTGEELHWRYLPEESCSALYKYNQVGYMPSAPEKYAYIGAWRGTGGAMPLGDYAGCEFTIIDASEGKICYSGKLRSRCVDPVNESGEPFTGEEVLELDFSDFSIPGNYFFYISGIGRSENFRIGDAGLAESFYTHARGLYHKRCGIAKESRYTAWSAPECHTRVFRGTFPPHDRHYSAGSAERDYGFFDSFHRPVNVNAFRLISENIPSPAEALELAGGWHDAADYDRRPYHLGIVGDLAAVYLLKPENFSDGQLNIPESGNGIPDILDEAVWGMRHLLSSQQEDGGVGTWIETVRHPTPGDPLPPEEGLTYYQSRATLNSTLEYAAYAAELALALKRAGAQEEYMLFRDSARRAWSYAINPANRKVSVYSYDGKTVFYHEPSELALEYLLKAGYNLSLLFNDPEYLSPLSGRTEELLSVMRRDSWRWSPLFWIELEVFRNEEAAVELPEAIRQARRAQIIAEADRMLEQQENNYPYRTIWYGSDEAWVHTMSWGTYHPLRRAEMLIVAHALTGESKYLAGAYLANDFHNGANAMGMTMTSGLGEVYPVRFLDLISYGDGVAEFVPGITPYMNTYGISSEDAGMAHGLFYPARFDQGFAGVNESLAPCCGLDFDSHIIALRKAWPIWRRWANLEMYNVPASEYTVWETIAPAAVTAGYLLNGASLPESDWLERRPASDIRELKGYFRLP